MVQRKQSPAAGDASVQTVQRHHLFCVDTYFTSSSVSESPVGRMRSFVNLSPDVEATYTFTWCWKLSLCVIGTDGGSNQ